MVQSTLALLLTYTAAAVVAVGSSKSGMFSTMFPCDLPHPAGLNASNAGEPLFLTPLLSAGQVEEARAKAAVKGFESLENPKSFSGFFTVNSVYNSNLFFWFVPAQYNAEKAPVVLWLQGGPGGSSLFGFFVEHGPFFVRKDGSVGRRTTSWALHFNMLYVDQPAGTGFSFTEDEAGYAENQDDVARDLYEALRQFYIMFPMLRDNDLYVTGESYGGKYVPAISWKIALENDKGLSQPMPLRGLAIGDGLVDPISQIDYGDFLFQTGLLDERDSETVDEVTEKTKQFIKKANWSEASEELDLILDIFTTKSQLNFYYNYLLQEQPVEFSYHLPLLQRAEVRKAIHVGNLTYDGISEPVHQHLSDDMTKSVKSRVERLLDRGYKVMIYNGQLDVVIPYALTEQFLSGLEWSGAEEYANATRLVWRVGPTDVAGYAREVGEFRQVMVRNAGHILPFDQPKWAFDMILRFIRGKSFG